MMPANDQSWMDAGLNIELIARARFLIAAVRQYEKNPSAAAWSIVAAAMEDMEITHCEKVG